MKIKQYIVTIEHYNGVVRIRTAATSKKAAIKIVMNAEGCPECAIIAIKQGWKK